MTLVLVCMSVVAMSCCCQTEEKVMEALKAETQRRQDGSAALAAVVAGNVLCVANAGDCRAVLVGRLK